MWKRYQYPWHNCYSCWNPRDHIGVAQEQGTWIWWSDVWTLSVCITSSENRIGYCVTGYYEIWFPPRQPYVNYDCVHPEKLKRRYKFYRQLSPHYNSYSYVKNLEICIQRRLEEYLWTTDNKFAYKKVIQQTCFILKEMIRFYRKHRTPVYVCFLDASKASDCVYHWKLFNVMIERKCPAFIIRLLLLWYRNQKLFIKWDSVLSEKVSVSNFIKQGGILSSKLFNIYVNNLNMSLNEKCIACCLNGNVVNYLYHADDLVLLSPTASGMNELLRVCEHFFIFDWD